MTSIQWMDGVSISGKLIRFEPHCTIEHYECIPYENILENIRYGTPISGRMKDHIAFKSPFIHTLALHAMRETGATNGMLFLVFMVHISLIEPSKLICMRFNP